MARTSIAVTTIAPAGVTLATTAVDQPNGMKVPAPTVDGMTVLQVTNTDTSPHTVTVRAGSPVLGTGTWPDLSTSVPASSTKFFGPFESARVLQADGTIWVDFQLGHAGTVAALQIAKVV